MVEREGAPVLAFADLALGRMEAGVSPLCPVFQQVGTHTPDVRDTKVIKTYLNACKKFRVPGIIYAYHERSVSYLLRSLRWHLQERLLAI